MSSPLNSVVSSGNFLARKHSGEDTKITTTHVNKLMSWISTGQTLYGMGRRVYDWYENKNSFTLTLNSQDHLYWHVQKWLLDLLPDSKQSSLEIRSEYGEDDTGRVVKMSYDGESSRFVNFNGHRINFGVGTPERASSGDGMIMFTKNLYIVVYSSEAKRAVIEHIKEIGRVAFTAKREAKILMYAKYGWEYKEAPLRNLDSVVLPEGQKQQIVKDIELFLESEESYINKGIPWHRGMLFEGPPGSGKTSLAKGLANHFGLDLYFLSVTNLKNDDELFNRISELPAKSFLLLEDVDCVKSMTDREAEGVTMSGMLNVLDGIATPHGMITMLTTNHVEELDDAILRPGRVDLQLHIGLPDVDQATKLFEIFYGRKPEVVIDPKGYSTAELTEIFKQNMSDAEAAELALMELVRK